MPTLTHKSTGLPVKVGDDLTDFRGDPAKVSSIEEPHKPSSTGRIYTVAGGSYFPSVFDCVWKDRTDGGAGV
jgi:hypothetical protein